MKKQTLKKNSSKRQFSSKRRFKKKYASTNNANKAATTHYNSVKHKQHVSSFALSISLFCLGVLVGQCMSNCSSKKSKCKTKSEKCYKKCTWLVLRVAGLGLAQKLVCKMSPVFVILPFSRG